MVKNPSQATAPLLFKLGAQIKAHWRRYPPPSAIYCYCEIDTPHPPPPQPLSLMVVPRDRPGHQRNFCSLNR
jgi:hypothetical protein